MDGHSGTDVTTKSVEPIVRTKRRQFRPNKWLALGVALIVGGIGATLVFVTQAATDTTNMYRLTNGSRYYYTISVPEKDFIVGTLKWKLESTTTYTNPTASLPVHVHKLQLKSDGNTWIFTTNATERDGLAASGLWTYKGIGFTAATSSTVPAGYCRQPWHRVQSRETTTKYLWTASQSERDSLIATGKWASQGVGFNLDYACTTNPTPIVSPTTTTPTPAPSTSSGCDSTSLKKPDGTYWACSFFDEFEGTTLNGAKWFVQETATSGYKSGPYGCFVNSSNNIGVSNGTLKLTARKEPAPISCNRLNSTNSTQYTTASVNTFGGRFSQTYGKFEVRAKILGAKVKGLQTSFWMWPVNMTKYTTDAGGARWPSSGEIDIAEIYHTYPDRAIPYLHYVFDPATTNTATNTNIPTNNYCMIDDIAQYHTYAVEWTSKNITIIYDGKVCMVNNWIPGPSLTKPQPFDHPFFLSLTQALGVDANGNGFEPGKTPLPAVTEVDYVRVWR